MHNLLNICTYVIISNNKIFWQRKLKKQSKSSKQIIEQYQAFGGCNYPSNVLDRINNLRLELLDEAALMFVNVSSWASLPTWANKNA